MLSCWSGTLALALSVLFLKSQHQFPSLVCPHTLDRVIRSLSWNQQSQTFLLTLPHIWCSIFRIYFILNIFLKCSPSCSVLHKFYVLPEVQVCSQLIIITVEAKHPLSIDDHCSPSIIRFTESQSLIDRISSERLLQWLKPLSSLFFFLIWSDFQSENTSWSVDVFLIFHFYCCELKHTFTFRSVKATFSPKSVHNLAALLLNRHADVWLQHWSTLPPFLHKCQKRLGLSRWPIRLKRLTLADW